jgi:hypothetical protein
MAFTLVPSIPTNLLDALTSTSDTTGSSYALPSDWASKGRPLVWQSVMVGSPSAISLQLQGALNDVDAQYNVLDTSTLATGEMRHVTPLNIRFIRVRQASRTGGTSVTVVVNI